jgi:hypothetical protein
MSVLSQKSSTVLIILHSQKVPRDFKSVPKHLRPVPDSGTDKSQGIYSAELKSPQAPFQCPFGVAAPGGFGS